MRKQRQHTRKNPYDDCGILSRLLMTWVLPLIKTGTQRPLTPADVYECTRADDPVYWSERLEK